MPNPPLDSPSPKPYRPSMPDETYPTPKKRGKRGPKPGHGGRPRKQVDTTKLAFTLARKGFTMEEIAESCGISYKQLKERSAGNKNLRAAIKSGRERLADNLEDSLFRRALGMTLPDCHISSYEGQVTVTPLTKHLAPDTLALIFALKNLRGAKWSDKQQLDVQTTVAGVPEAILDRLRAKWRAKQDAK